MKQKAAVDNRIGLPDDNFEYSRGCRHHGRICQSLAIRKSVVAVGKTWSSKLFAQAMEFPVG